MPENDFDPLFIFGQFGANAGSVNGGVKPCQWGGAKVGQFVERALERAALK